MSVYNRGEGIEPPRRVDNDMKLQPWVPDRFLNLTHVPNTIITCRLCRGSKYVVARHMNQRAIKTNSGDLVPCPNCLTTGLQKSTHIDELWGINR